MRHSSFVTLLLFVACDGPLASPAPVGASYLASLPWEAGQAGMPTVVSEPGGAGGSAAAESGGSGGELAIQESGSSGASGGATEEADPCWDRPGMLCYCGLPITAPPGGAGYNVVAACAPPAAPNPSLEWCCDTYAGICRCWERQKGECQYWRDQGFWVSGCSAS
jgi:hypothetical protein